VGALGSCRWQAREIGGDVSYCELPSFYDCSEPIARKRHVCCECSAPIEVGEKHFRGAGQWRELGFCTYRQHLACMEACMLIRDSFNGGDCIGFGELMEEFSNMRGGYSRSDPDWIKLRSLMAKIRWRERRNGL
jgi:hypothetical protein